MFIDPEPDARDGTQLLYTTARLLQHREDQVLAPLGLTCAAVNVLESVVPHALNQEQLAAKIRVKSQTVGRVIIRLEKDGLLTRTRNTTDRRQFLVHITTAGREALEAAVEVERLALPQDFDQWDTLRDLLAQLLHSSHLTS